VQAAWPVSQWSRQLNHASDASHAARKKVEFVVSSTGEGDFETGLKPLAFHPDETFAALLGVKPVETLLWTLTERTHPDPGLSLSRAAEPVRKSLQRLRVLLTDDKAINHQVIKRFLAPQGCDLIGATNGKEALDLRAKQTFDIVLLDVHMPVMDGKETIPRIRAKLRWTSLPVIALTADAVRGDREKSIVPGITDDVSRPVAQRELITKCERPEDRGSAAGQAQRLARCSPRRPHTAA
jgi:CheY-like chemotaxis protein